MEDIFIQYIGEWGWLVLLALVSFVFKDTITNFVIGVQFLWGNDFNVDDIVYIRGTKRARIVRQNLWKTTFYVYGHGRKFVVPNKSLWKLDIEKEIMGEEERKFNNQELKLLLDYLKLKREKRSQINKK
jgi:hypothetical protein